MHELSITQSIVDLVAERMVESMPGRTVVAVHVRVGRLSGVMPEAMLFCFDIAAAGTPLDGSRLEIEEDDGQELLVVALELEKEATCA